MLACQQASVCLFVYVFTVSMYLFVYQCDYTVCRIMFSVFLFVIINILISRSCVAIVSKSWTVISWVWLNPPPRR